MAMRRPSGLRSVGGHLIRRFSVRRLPGATRLVGVFALALGVLGVVSLAGGAAGRQASPLRLSRAASRFETVPAVPALRVAARQAAQVLAAATGSPGAVRERLRSTSEFRGETPAAALHTAQKVFPGAVSGPVWHGPVLPAGSRVARYLSSSTALIATPGKRAMSLMTSSTSLTGSTATGATAPVNLGLAPDAGGFAPISAPVRVQIPGSTSAPVVFPSGVRVDLPHTRSGVSAMLSNDHAFYGAASTDEDVAITQAVYIDAQRIGRGWMFAHRAQMQPGSRAVDIEP